MYYRLRISALAFDTIILFILSISHLLCAYQINMRQISTHFSLLLYPLSLKLSNSPCLGAYCSSLVATSTFLFFFSYCCSQVPLFLFTLIDIFGFDILFIWDFFCYLNPLSNLKRQEKKKNLIID